MITGDYWGSQVVWFTGVVEDRHDPLESNRVRVRVHGIHPGSKSQLSTGDLPWALVGMPATTGGSSGVGSTPHRLVEGAWVYGIFLDGMVAQQPLVLGTILGINEVTADDPCGINNSSGSYSADDSLTSYGTVPPINVAGNSHREKTFNFFMSKGYTAEQAAGITGNLMVESSTNINPTIVNSIGATGIAQWLGNRKSGLFSWSKQNGYDWRALETQLLYISYELNTTETRSNRLVKQATTPEDAALAFCTFERDESYSNGRCNPNAVMTRKRMGYARDTFDKYANGRTTSPQTTTPDDTPAQIPDGSTTDAGPSADVTNRCSPTDIVESTQKLQNEMDAAIPTTLQLVSTNDQRDVKSDVSAYSGRGDLLIRRDGTIQRVNSGAIGSNVVVLLEGGNASFAGAVSKSENFTGYYPQSQLNTLVKLINTAKEANPSVSINGEQAVGLDRTIFEGSQ